MSIRAIIADDESLMRSGLRLLLGAADDIEIIAEAAHGAEAIDLARELGPDLILMDIRMPVMNGLEATRTLMAQASHPEVLILTAFGTDEFVYQALRSGAAGYILKDTPPDELIHAVRAAANGTRTLSPSAVESLLGRGTTSATGLAGGGDGGAGPLGAGNPHTPDPLEPLTAREREIAEAVAQGMTNAQVARSLFVSTATVKTHLARIFYKLDVSTRVQLALLVNERR
ncbi:DNA-binding response regulator, NarL/FixJ family, contains REC and HTH domains [Brevibacterium sandarakinum]|uniref:DNA-binding response regulator, NarL/FixJ family, contains REC and HTH domains n=1 Tax=Brevibacterium sandarakinum TaxID=629680 RepID=A0A1H1TFT1_BRESA|nr:response regulator transcription factor [Brevibacterium sandarakinum]SDS59113.1 DNA-binding response regulator, NarL/FixJ family, contains REC and HTH domains [Brevibacterium sandarakinum]